MAWRVLEWVKITLKLFRRYRDVHGRWPDLVRPRRYTEKMQWRKLFDLDDSYTVLSDKYAVRAFIADRIGSEHLAQCLWYGDDPDKIPFGSLTPPFFVKNAHGSLQVIHVKQTVSYDDISGIVGQARGWLAHNHGLASLEPGYVGVPPGVIVEKAIVDADGGAPLELKAYVFGGQIASFLAVRVDPETRKRFRCHLSREWRPLGWAIKDEDEMPSPPDRPADLTTIQRAAEAVSAGYDHLRVDMYYSDGRVFIGELTVYSQSGLAVFLPDEMDFELGRRWLGDFSLRRAIRTIFSRDPPTSSAVYLSAAAHRTRTRADCGGGAKKPLSPHGES